MKFSNEKEVEFFYWSALEKVGKQFDKNFTLTAANKTDGYLEAGNIKVLCEIKYGFDFSSTASVARVLIQALYYIKQRQKRGQDSPSSIFVGDDNEYFIVSVKQFADYLDSAYNNEIDPNWEFSPSSAYKLNTKLYQDLLMKTIPLMIKKLNAADNIDIPFIVSRIGALASNENIKTKLNSNNINKPFHYFTQSVLLGGENIKDHTKIKLFFAIITGSEDVIYTKGKIRYEKTDYSINDSYYAGFVNIYQTKYKTSEREDFISKMDNLIKEEARRFHGAYFTPKVIVDYAHETITKNLGENWREEYVVWDPAAGTLNLTRDYQFRELYCSTLFQEELDLASDYNPEATKFQFDFLNDEFKSVRDGGKVPNGLYDAVNDENKKVMILMNPPYGAPGSGALSKSASSKTGLGLNNINAEMKKLNLGHACQDLYTMFIYRVIKLFERNKNSVIAQFTKTNFLRSESMYNFAKLFKNNFNIEEIFAFNSGYFDGTYSDWPISFTLAKKTYTSTIINMDTNVRYVKKNDNNEIIDIRNGKFYIVEDVLKASTWVRSDTDKSNLINVQITLSMPTTLQKVLPISGKIYNNNLGYFSVNSNNIRKADAETSIFSSSYSNGHGVAINKLNFFKVHTLFAARKLPTKDLFNYQDEFLKPDESHEKFEEFKNNSLIYSLFNNTSYQSSLRKIGYDDKGEPINYPTEYKKGNINVYNEWFFLSQKEISDLADEHFPEVYQDTKNQKDRYVYLELEKLIKENKISKEALDVLEAGRKLFKDTFPLRQTLHTRYPEYHLNAWDAGYWQLRTVLKKSNLEIHLEDLNKKYKILEDKMKPLVYELGFLKNN
jgi:hypothetical protein